MINIIIIFQRLPFKKSIKNEQNVPNECLFDNKFIFVNVYGNIMGVSKIPGKMLTELSHIFFLLIFLLICAVFLCKVLLAKSR